MKSNMKSLCGVVSLVLLLLGNGSEARRRFFLRPLEHVQPAEPEYRSASSSAAEQESDFPLLVVKESAAQPAKSEGRLFGNFHGHGSSATPVTSSHPNIIIVPVPQSGSSFGNNLGQLGGFGQLSGLNFGLNNGLGFVVPVNNRFGLGNPFDGFFNLTNVNNNVLTNTPATGAAAAAAADVPIFFRAGSSSAQPANSGNVHLIYNAPVPSQQPIRFSAVPQQQFGYAASDDDGSSNEISINRMQQFRENFRNQLLQIANRIQYV